jgi:DNA-binding FadR family transcriptional regulator
LASFANPQEILEARVAVEPVVAALAALRSSPRDWDRLEECVEAGRAARTLAAFERWDREFHLRTPGRRETYGADHAAILRALRARRVEEARERMRVHLVRVQENLFGSGAFGT